MLMLRVILDSCTMGHKVWTVTSVLFITFTFGDKSRDVITGWSRNMFVYSNVSWLIISGVGA